MYFFFLFLSLGIKITRFDGVESHKYDDKRKRYAKVKYKIACNKSIKSDKGAESEGVDCIHRP